MTINGVIMACYCGVVSEYEGIPERVVCLLEERVHLLTDLLCKIGRALSEERPIPVECVKWLEDHACFDKERGEPWIGDIAKTINVEAKIKANLDKVKKLHNDNMTIKKETKELKL